MRAWVLYFVHRESNNKVVLSRFLTAVSSLRMRAKNVTDVPKRVKIF